MLINTLIRFLNSYQTLLLLPNNHRCRQIQQLEVASRALELASHYRSQMICIHNLHLLSPLP